MRITELKGVTRDGSSSVDCLSARPKGSKEPGATGQFNGYFLPRTLSALASTFFLLAALSLP